MDPITMMLISGGLQGMMGAQGAQAQQQQQAAQNLAAAAQTRYSPWTNMGAGQIKLDAKDPSSAAFGGALSGGLQGYMAGKGMQNTDAANAAASGNQKLQDEKLKEEIAWLKMKSQMGSFDPSRA